MSIMAGDALQYVNRLLSDLWTNSITWQDSDSICSQSFSLLVYLSHTLPWNLLMCNNSTVLPFSSKVSSHIPRLRVAACGGKRGRERAWRGERGPRSPRHAPSLL